MPEIVITDKAASVRGALGLGMKVMYFIEELNMKERF